MKLAPGTRARLVDDVLRAAGFPLDETEILSRLRAQNHHTTEMSLRMVLRGIQARCVVNGPLGCARWEASKETHE